MCITLPHYSGSCQCAGGGNWRRWAAKLEVTRSAQVFVVAAYKVEGCVIWGMTGGFGGALVSMELN